MARLIDIEGIGAKYAEQLKKAGIGTTTALLNKGATPQGRADIGAKTGISNKLILEWVNLADLFRINGVGEEYADLLEEAGVDTIPELAQRNAANLYAQMGATNAQKKLVRRLPSEAQVADWITQAKTLPRVIKY